MSTTRRLFFAAWPDDALRERLASLASRLQHHCGGRTPVADNLHLTLGFIGNVPAAETASLQTLTERLTLPAGEWTLDRYGYFRKPRLAWLGGPPTPTLNLWHARLDDALKASGRPLPDWHDYRPHITLLRHAEKAPPATLEAPEWAWPLTRLTLVESILDGTRPVYRVLAECPATPASY
ncbi:RNA 2',3'-cyclic phosphodiesterase [Chromohalobacter canadensis]|uniref:RNA 2',3'-cyclic phosphodiesterase n=1 Tax=Chromohalobacter canadensis TaxID=141389 RepID=UPI0021C207EF|nr:RNA 2',3'-cyclic phosphodiesterase [Chromohalobacter canadensis]MCT8469148.1 RNA 2',3'-cyclic phosphodiesterase [Chromohalobacter canadensis]MCT8472662.1 RNA 2',3'-cyclic phosphodiesterase [Chromohalobacter canadensis]MCT8500115.1 RNA 2',3'-cyclic phosphodiesterase [Chromohalobacter canadensis]